MTPIALICRLILANNVPMMQEKWAL